MMFQQRKTFSILLVLLAGLIFSVLTVRAATVTFTVTTDTNATAQFGTLNECGGTQFTNATAVQEFYVDVGGDYTIRDIPANGLTAFMVYADAFDRTDTTINCIAPSGNTFNTTVTLQPDRQYLVVVFSTTISAQRTTTIEISGPGNILFGVSPRIPLNARYGDSHIGILFTNSGGGIDLYLHETGRYTGNFVAPDMISEDAPTENTLIAQRGMVSAYHLTTGQIQFNFGPDAEGKQYTFIVDALTGANRQGSAFDPNR